ncbi:MAG: response regulator transcription factor [Sandaracinaceae bacterium]|nr:response regulator transcription factor [Sandaracinaceae bacterium]
MNTIRIVIADDHVVLRHSLATMLGAQVDMVVVGEASDGPSVVALVGEHHPDLVILDLTMPGGGGLAALQEIRAQSPGTRCLVLSMHDEPAALHRVLQAGGGGYVTKRASAQELLRAIRSVASGGAYFNIVMPDTGPAPATLALVESLSPREREVFLRVARGFTSKEIAAELGIRHTTVDVYRSRLMKKLGVTSRAELVDLALQAGLMAPS